MHTFSFVTRDFKTIFQFIDILMHFFNFHFSFFSFFFLKNGGQLFRAVTNEGVVNDLWISGRRQIVILLILIMNRISDRILPCGFGLESISFCTWKVWSSRKYFMKVGSLLCIPRSLRFGVCNIAICQAFSLSKRTATRCFLCMLLIRVSIRTIWSMALLALKP